MVSQSRPVGNQTPCGIAADPALRLPPLPCIVPLADRLVGQRVRLGKRALRMFGSQDVPIHPAQFHVDALAPLLEDHINMGLSDDIALERLLHEIDSTDNLNEIYVRLQATIYEAQAKRIIDSTTPIELALSEQGFRPAVRQVGYLQSETYEGQDIFTFCCHDVINIWQFNHCNMTDSLSKAVVSLGRSMAQLAGVWSLVGEHREWELAEILGKLDTDTRSALALLDNDDDFFDALKGSLGAKAYQDLLDIYVEYFSFTLDDDDGRQEIYRYTQKLFADLAYDDKWEYDDNLVVKVEHFDQLSVQLNRVGQGSLSPSEKTLLMHLGFLVNLTQTHYTASDYEFTFYSDLEYLGAQQFYLFGDVPCTVEETRLQEMEEHLMNTGEQVVICLFQDDSDCLTQFRNIQLGWLLLEALQQALEAYHGTV